MKFSNHYPKIDKTDCFDPILIADTKLFVDPFAMFEEKEGVFSNSFKKMIDFFNEGFKLAAKAQFDKQSISYKKLESMMVFPEINELGLGYSGANIGSGSSKYFRDHIIDAIYRSIKQGITGYKHFEEIGIFEEGIGCDRISDITCNILKEEFIKYTQEICCSCNIQLHSFKMKHIRFDFRNLRWIDGEVNLPFNQYKNCAVLLVPKRFLNDLPTINPDDFRDFIWDNKNEILRNDLNYTIKKDLDKSAIIKIARDNPGWIKDYEKRAENRGYTEYNLKSDYKGVYLWASNDVQKHVESNPITYDSNENFTNCIFQMCNEFKNFIENNKGYSLLWDGEKAKPESAVQRLLYGVTKMYCMSLDIDITAESNAGSGPVDFKYSHGYTKRVLVETKLISNTKYWNGLTKQLPQYMQAEGIDSGIFILIAYTDEELNKVDEFKKKVKNLNLPYNISIITVDASTANKISASKL